jgi:hypothetical protein
MCKFLVVVVLVVITPVHIRNPHSNYQSIVQPLHCSRAGCQAAYQDKLPSLLQETETSVHARAKVWCKLPYNGFNDQSQQKWPAPSGNQTWVTCFSVQHSTRWCLLKEKHSLGSTLLDCKIRWFRWLRLFRRLSWVIFYCRGKVYILFVQVSKFSKWHELLT